MQHSKCITKVSLYYVSDFNKATTAILSQRKRTLFCNQDLPQTAAAITIGTSSLAVMVTVVQDDDH